MAASVKIPLQIKLLPAFLRETITRIKTRHGHILIHTFSLSLVKKIQKLWNFFFFCLFLS